MHNTLRAWKNPAALEVTGLEAKGAGMWEILSIVAGAKARRMVEEGDVDAGVIACSRSIGLVREVKPVAEVIRGMVREAAAIREQLGGRRPTERPGYPSGLSSRLILNSLLCPAPGRETRQKPGFFRKTRFLGVESMSWSSLERAIMPGGAEVSWKGGRVVDSGGCLAGCAIIGPPSRLINGTFP